MTIQSTPPFQQSNPIDLRAQRTLNEALATGAAGSVFWKLWASWGAPALKRWEYSLHQRIVGGVFFYISLLDTRPTDLILCGFNPQEIVTLLRGSLFLVVCFVLLRLGRSLWRRHVKTSASWPINKAWNAGKLEMIRKRYNTIATQKNKNAWQQFRGCVLWLRATGYRHPFFGSKQNVWVKDSLIHFIQKQPITTYHYCIPKCTRRNGAFPDSLKAELSMVWHSI